MDITNRKISTITLLDTPFCIKEEYPLETFGKEIVKNSRMNVEKILNSETLEKMIVIVGPCSIHDYNSALEYAKFLKDCIEKYGDKLEIIMRTYFSKPRTSIGWKGYIYDPDLNGTSDILKGLRNSRELLLEILKLGVPCSMEHVDTILPQYFDDLLSWSAIGARTTESQVHREVASGVSSAIGFKNSTDGNVDIAINTVKSANNSHSFIGCDIDGNISKITTLGNDLAHIILRGGNDGPNYYSNNILCVKEKLDKANIIKSIIVDCSHGNSLKQHKKQIDVCRDICSQIEMGENSIKGIMLESNICEGNQNINDKPLKYGVSITDACLDLSDTEDCLDMLYRTLSDNSLL